MSILKCIEAVSGLRVNPSKTKLIQVCQVPDLHQWAANTWECLLGLNQKQRHFGTLLLKNLTQCWPRG